MDRTQALLLPDRLEDYVHQDNPVRLVDAFVDALDLGSLGFEAANRGAGGRPAYHPAALLKIYIYGHLNRMQSSQPVAIREGHGYALWQTVVQSGQRLPIDHPIEVVDCLRPALTIAMGNVSRAYPVSFHIALEHG